MPSSTATAAAPLNKAEAAAVMRCSKRTVQRRVAAGQLDCIRDSAGRVLFLPEHIDAYWVRHTKPAAPPSRKPTRSPRYV